MSKAPPDKNQKNNTDPGMTSGLKSWQRMEEADIKVVQNMIKRCLKNDMSKKDTIENLHRTSKFEPMFTRAVWDDLEYHNQEFFRAYYVRQALKDQILTFNELLEKQAQLMMQPESVDSTSDSCMTAESVNQQGNGIRRNWDEVTSAARMNQDQLLSDNAVVNADTSAPGTMNHEKPEHLKKLD